LAVIGVGMALQAGCDDDGSKGGSGDSYVGAVVKSISSAERAKVEADLKALDTAVKMFEAEQGHIPSQEEGFSVMDIDPPTDPWGNPYVYERTGTRYEVYCVGPDGQAGTPDDVHLGQ
jgi:hypothetical protein